MLESLYSEIYNLVENQYLLFTDIWSSSKFIVKSDVGEKIGNIELFEQNPKQTDIIVFTSFIFQKLNWSVPCKKFYFAITAIKKFDI